MFKASFACLGEQYLIVVQVIRLPATSYQVGAKLNLSVHHDNRSCIIIQIPNNYRHSLFSGDFTGMMPPMSDNQLIAAIRIKPGYGRSQNAILPDAFGGIHHCFVILNFKRTVLKKFLNADGMGIHFCSPS